MQRIVMTVAVLMAMGSSALAQPNTGGGPEPMTPTRGKFECFLLNAQLVTATGKCLAGNDKACARAVELERIIQQDCI